MTPDLALEAAVDQVTALLNRHIGLRPEPTLRGRLRRCIRDEATADGRDPLSYVKILAGDHDALQRLLNRVTVQETSFFRHPEHFDVLAREILPGLSAPVRIWSAGCANGQEAYSIAMVLEEAGIAGTVIATDVSTAALHRTETARYARRELTGLSPARIARHLTGSDNHWLVNQSLRSRVLTLRHNLIDPLPEPVRFCHVVFCRNVLIYFSPEHTRAFLDRIADALPKQGYLFLGSAEAIWPLSDRFDTVSLDNTFVYRPRVEPVLERAPAHPAEQPRPARERRRGLRPIAGREPVVTGKRSRPAAPVGSASAGQPVPALAVAESARQLAESGQLALAVDDWPPAIVAFRKWAYLTPEDAMAHVHLGLALEASGDQPAAQRAYGAARRAVLHADHGPAEPAIDGYAPQELLRLLDAKHLGTAR